MMKKMMAVLMASSFTLNAPVKRFDFEQEMRTKVAEELLTGAPRVAARTYADAADILAAHVPRREFCAKKNAAMALSSYARKALIKECGICYNLFEAVPSDAAKLQKYWEIECRHRSDFCQGCWDAQRVSNPAKPCPLRCVWGQEPVALVPDFAPVIQMPAWVLNLTLEPGEELTEAMIAHCRISLTTTYRPSLWSNDEFSHDLRTWRIAAMGNSYFAHQILALVVTCNSAGLRAALRGHAHARSMMSDGEFYEVFVKRGVNAAFLNNYTALCKALEAPGKQDLPEAATVPVESLPELTPEQKAAIEAEKLVMVRYLLEAGAHPEGNMYFDNESGLFFSYESALHWAVFEGNVAGFTELLRYTTNINVCNASRHEKTALECAVERSNNQDLSESDRAKATAIIALIDAYIVEHPEQAAISV